jgi:RsiW-degrading membrane proteinase PrsW (M82 family)
MYGPLVLLLLIIISSIPVIAVFIWYRLAKFQFTLIHFLFALLAGAAAFFPALILQDILNITLSARGRMELFYHVFVRIAFTEELSRLLLLLVYFWLCGKIGRHNPEKQLVWSDLNRGASTGLVAGLGFALLETAAYGASDIGVLLLRAVTAAPLHAACGSRVGIASVLLRTNPFQAFLRLLTATAIHGIYNLMITMPGLPSIMAVLIAISTLASSIISIRAGWKTPQPTP